MTPRWSRRLGEPLPWAAGCAATLLYLTVHSSFYNFDGVACAIAVELGDCRVLVHGNHLGYGWLGSAFYRLWRLLGYAGPAMIPLQALSSLLGGAGIGLFARAARRAGAPPAAAAAAAAALAVCSAWWFWSLEAQVYMLGAACLMGALGEALSERPRPGALGLWHAGAVLGHVGHAMFFPAALYLLWTATPEGRRKDAARRYAGTLAAALFCCYAAAAVFCVRPADWHDLKLWLLGSAALADDRSFAWHGAWSLAGLGEWARTTLRVFCEPAFASGAQRALGTLLSALGALGGVGAGAWLWRRGETRLPTAAALWIAAYALLYVSWEPHLPVYRISDLAAFWLLLAAAAARDARAPLALAGWAALALPLNYLAHVRPAANPSRNEPLQEALWLKDATPSESWIVVWGQAQVYVPYFAHRRTLNLRWYEAEPERLAARLDELVSKSESVFVTDDTLEFGDWRARLQRYGLEEAGITEDRTLHRLRRPRMRPVLRYRRRRR